MREYYVIEGFKIDTGPGMDEAVKSIYRRATEEKTFHHCYDDKENRRKRIYFEDLEAAKQYAESLVPIADTKLLEMVNIIKVYVNEEAVRKDNKNKEDDLFQKIDLPLQPFRKGQENQNNAQKNTTVKALLPRGKYELKIRETAIYGGAHHYSNIEAIKAAHWFRFGTVPNKSEVRVPSSYYKFFKSESFTSRNQSEVQVSPSYFQSFKSIFTSRKPATKQQSEHLLEDINNEPHSSTETGEDRVFIQQLQAIFKDYHKKAWLHWDRNYTDVAKEIENGLGKKSNAQEAFDYLLREHRKFKSGSDGSLTRRLEFAIRVCQAYITKKPITETLAKGERGYDRDGESLPLACN